MFLCYCTGILDLEKHVVLSKLYDKLKFVKFAKKRALKNDENDFLKSKDR